MLSKLSRRRPALCLLLKPRGCLPVKHKQSSEPAQHRWPLVSVCAASEQTPAGHTESDLSAKKLYLNKQQQRQNPRTEAHMLNMEDPPSLTFIYFIYLGGWGGGVGSVLSTDWSEAKPSQLRLQSEPHINAAMQTSARTTMTTC